MGIAPSPNSYRVRRCGPWDTAPSCGKSLIRLGGYGVCGEFLLITSFKGFPTTDQTVKSQLRLICDINLKQTLFRNPCTTAGYAALGWVLCLKKTPAPARSPELANLTHEFQAKHGIGFAYGRKSGILTCLRHWDHI